MGPLPDPGPVAAALKESRGGWAAVSVIIGTIVGVAFVVVLEPLKLPESCGSMYAEVPAMIAQCNEKAWAGQALAILLWLAAVAFVAGGGAILGLLIYRNLRPPKTS